MLAKLGVSYVVMGHSERREYHNESDALVGAKARKVLDAGMTPILCCGEALEIRKAGTHVDFVLGQIRAALEGWSGEDVAKIVIAYEPIWAIGTGETATAEDAQEVCGAIREALARRLRRRHRRRHSHPLRRLCQARQHQGAHGPARRRRRTRRRSLPQGGLLRRHGGLLRLSDPDRHGETSNHFPLASHRSLPGPGHLTPRGVQDPVRCR